MPDFEDIHERRFSDISALTDEEIIEMRRLIRMSQSARLLWSIIVGLMGVIGSAYAIADYFFKK